MKESIKKGSKLFLFPAELVAEENRFDPYPWFQEMRSNSPVRYNEVRDCWEVFTYEDVHRVYQDHHVFSSDRSQLEGTLKSIIGVDPPRHTSLRALVSKAFTPSAIQEMAPLIQQTVDTLLDAVVVQGEMDVARDLAIPLPVTVIAEMLGVSPDDRELFRKWSDIFFSGAAGAANGKSLEEAMREKQESFRALTEYFLRVFEERRAVPQNDLVTRLLQAEIDGERLTEREIVDFCILLLAAGNETTTHLIANALRCFLDEPGLLDVLKKEPALLPAATEEVLRFRSPATGTVRLVKEDVILSGVTIPAGEYVMAWISSANRDEKKFPHAHRFLNDRTPNQHIAFATGLHYCLGAQLARLEAHIALQTIIQRLSNIRYADKAALKPLYSHLAHGLAVFPIQFDEQ